MMRSGWHAVWDAHVDLLFREWMMRELAGASRDAIIAFEVRFTEAVTEAAEKIGKSLAPLADLVREAGL